MPTLAPPAARLLDLWQAADGLAPMERSLALAAGGAREPAALDRLPLGRLNARLLALHVELGGRLLEATASCPACGELAEFSLDAAALAAGAVEVAPAPLQVGAFVVSWRSPECGDVVAAAAAGDVRAAERVLLSRCVTSATGPDGGVGGAELPAPVREAVARAMAAADPLAEVLAEVACPACGTGFVADLDVAEFAWTVLRARAWSLLRDVAALGRAYGWTEADVVALGDRRRAAYLELAREAAG
jgi:hypothetical protein